MAFSGTRARPSHAPILVKPARAARLRLDVFARDRGVCVLCGTDTEWLRRQLVAADRFVPKRMAERDELRRIGFDPDAPLWHADHVVPLAEGGADTLANFRTLCVPCHRTVTAEQAARRGRQHTARATLPGKEGRGFCVGSRRLSGRYADLTADGLGVVFRCRQCDHPGERGQRLPLHRPVVGDGRAPDGRASPSSRSARVRRSWRAA